MTEVMSGLGTPVTQFILGTSRIPPGAIQEHEWDAIIHETIKKLHLPNDLGLFTSLRKIVTCQGYERIEQRLGSTTRLLDAKQGNGYISIASAGLSFPEAWYKATDQGRKRAETIVSAHLVLSQKRELHGFEIIWVPKEKWSAEHNGSPEFWYESEGTAIVYSHPVPDYIARARALDALDPDVGILMSLRNLSEQVTGMLENRYRAARSTTREIEGSLKRMNYW